ncbi:hypothetical protein TSOC_011495 [Tetrabaena socialis]|uniref:DUF7880 domain-containing protein n=1 Tax=Tetrabaena socialis TaxID=47790 RepID=A0A2J7ZQH7_9CHLO|nr:hypothetical protein TSOC_011495 [Tetrabaena socialis]|eukprot:PNH02521.1 hypothetical protein TSOC_011495 [Tetrabaena socialis]
MATPTSLLLRSNLECRPSTRTSVFSSPASSSPAAGAVLLSPSPPPANRPPSSIVVNRRDVLILSSSLVVSHLASMGVAPPARAREAGVNRYIRKKSLDPLVTYVPLVLEARGLLAGAKELAAKDVGAARELLREGPYRCGRIHARAGPAAGERDPPLLDQDGGRRGRGGATSSASPRRWAPPARSATLGRRTSCCRTSEVGPLISGIFRALESYDQLLSGALLAKTPVVSEELDAAIKELYGAFDRLLATVPADALERAGRVLEVAGAKAKAAEAGGGGGSAAEADADAEAADLVMLLR